MTHDTSTHEPGADASEAIGTGAPSRPMGVVVPFISGRRGPTPVRFGDRHGDGSGDRSVDRSGDRSGDRSVDRSVDRSGDGSGDGAFTVDCADCSHRLTSVCDDCIVSFIVGREPEDALVVDADEARAVRLLEQAGLVPGVRHQPRASGL